jgi:hypothetical protein
VGALLLDKLGVEVGKGRRTSRERQISRSARNEKYRDEYGVTSYQTLGLEGGGPPPVFCKRC